MTAGYVPVCNVTDRPLVVDGEGRTLGGGEWGATLKSAEQVKAALGRGELVELDGDAGTPEAKAAVDLARILEQRAGAFGKLDRDALLEHTGEHGGNELVPSAADLSVAELRHALTVRTGIPVPARKAANSPEEK